MKRLQLTAAAICLAAAPMLAFAADPMVGTWALDAAKSKNLEPMSPKTEIITATAAGYKFREISEMHPGARQASDVDVVLDGKPHTLDIQGSKLTQTFTRKDARTIEISSLGDGQPLGTATVALSPDGKTLSITESGPPGTSAPLVRVYDKQ